MDSKKLIIIIFLLFLNIHFAISAIWTTVSEGYWDSPSVWSTGIAPPYSSSDTFVIEHPIAFMDNLILNAGAFMMIDSSGGLCAHRNITVNAGASIIKYGILEVDSLLIPGGQVNCYIPGEVILWRYAIISNGGSLTSNCSLSIGPWFNCRSPQFDFTGVPEYENENTISIFPNPANSIIDFNKKNSWFLYSALLIKYR